MIGPKIGELFKKILQKTLRYYSVLRRPSHSDGDWDADVRATSQFRPGHGAGASGMPPTNVPRISFATFRVYSRITFDMVLCVSWR
jgi:hypothetical protein